MKIIGHRGIPSYSPENSLISLDYLKKFKLKKLASYADKHGWIISNTFE